MKDEVFIYLATPFTGGFDIMRAENQTSMENLSLICHVSGLFSVFVGILVIAIDFYNGNFMHIQVGFYVFITGYANVKISKKVSAIMYSERE